MQTRIDTLIKLALEEDAGYGDITSEAIFQSNHQSTAKILAREAMVVCGLEIAAQVFRHVDPSVKVDLETSDGTRVDEDSTLLVVEGPTIALLTAERTALNFIQRLSGIASISHLYAKAAEVAATGVRVVDTRKTTPGWRALEKYAVRCGGCHNHRSSLGEHVLIKENHIQAAGSLTEAVNRCRATAPHCAKIEVETESLDEVREAIAAGAEIIMLDNFSPAMVKKAVALIKGVAMIEISGGVNLETLPGYAMVGVDVISVGALTHSARAADLSMIVTSLAGQ